jgi:hypothetical protein
MMATIANINTIIILSQLSIQEPEAALPVDDEEEDDLDDAEAFYEPENDARERELAQEVTNTLSDTITLTLEHKNRYSPTP